MKHKNKNSQETFDKLKADQMVVEAPYHPGYEDAAVDPDKGRPLHQVIRQRMIAGKKRFWAGDNVSEYVSETEKKKHGFVNCVCVCAAIS